MATRTKTPPAPLAPAAPASPYADLIADLGGLPAPRAATRPTKPKAAADYRTDVDQAIILAAGTIVNDLVPEKYRETVARMVANQLHHLASPKTGWPSPTLPVPDRSEWR